jgi:hypothetical protein
MQSCLIVSVRGSQKCFGAAFPLPPGRQYFKLLPYLFFLEAWARVCSVGVGYTVRLLGTHLASAYEREEAETHRAAGEGRTRTAYGRGSVLLVR